MRLSRAIDLWMGELARAGRTPNTRASYERYLFKFVGQLEKSRPDVDVREVTTNDCRRLPRRLERALIVDRLHDPLGAQWLLFLAAPGG